MPFTHDEIRQLTQKYGYCSDWAVWNKTDDHTREILDNPGVLHSEFVFISMCTPVSSPAAPWMNYHNAEHNQILRKALNIPPFRGSYMTYLLKGLDECSQKAIIEHIRKGRIDILEHAAVFREEMKAVGVTADSHFIIFGSYVCSLFKKHFRKKLEVRPAKTVYMKSFTELDLLRESETEWLEELYFALVT